MKTIYITLLVLFSAGSFAQDQKPGKIPPEKWHTGSYLEKRQHAKVIHFQ